MAYTKIHAIKKTLKKALDYIENPEKTDDALLVSGYNVDPLTASIEYEMTAQLAKDIKGNYTQTGGGNNLAYHMIQSFSPNDNVTPEQAHEIGKKLADEFLQGKYEYVISTHIDKGHIHNHIVFNSISFLDFKKFRTQPYKTAARIRAISDKICSEERLSVIEKPGRLSYSYKEYSARRTNSSWKSEIRKRLAFVMDQATSFEEFRESLEQLGVTFQDAGKMMKYQMTGQERFTRADTLSDTGDYLKENILDRLEANKKSQKIIKEAIKSAASEADSYNEFSLLLEKKYHVISKKQRSGQIVYKVDDVNGITVKERALGREFQEAAIQEAIHSKDFSFINGESTNIQEEFEKNIRPKQREEYTAITLKPDNICKITVDGILIDLTGPEEKGRVFIDNSYVDFVPETESYQIHIGSKYDYYYAAKKLDPDTLESQQLSGKNIKGENIIRAIELANEVNPLIVEISGTDLQGIGEKGAVLSAPEIGIEKLFLESEFIEYSRQDGGICKAKLYENWNYTYTRTNGDKASINGRELASLLNEREIKKTQSLIYKVAAMERKEKIKETKGLAKTLLLLRREDINTEKDFESRIGTMREQAAQIKEKLDLLQEKNKNYNEAVKYLLAFQKFLPYKQELEDQSIFTRKKFESRYEGELKAFDFAAQQLEKMGVRPEVDVDKVKGLIGNQQEQINNLSEKYKQVIAKIEEIRTAQITVQNIQMQDRNGYTRKEREEKDANAK